MTDGESPRRFVLVTGMSGAGLSTTLKSLEDLGYEVLDKSAPGVSLTPRGEIALREGDYVAFPTHAGGAHKIVNRTEGSCELLLIANTEPHDVCTYPDSHKVLIERSGLMLRDHPVLEYFDGE